ncbi:kinase-like domain-containing protein [Mycena latifolia]|nr:kinase-like domain-containing protein [Mycena latifolia]
MPDCGRGSKAHEPETRFGPAKLYKNTFLFLKGLDAFKNLDFSADYAATDSVSDLARSLESRKTLLQFAGELGVDDDPRLRDALGRDAQHVLKQVVALIQSPEATRAASRLECEDAERLFDVVQNTLLVDLSMTPEDRQAAEQLKQKLFESFDQVPSSLLIYGVTKREQRPSFCGYDSDIYRASYRGEAVALKRLRVFIEDSRTARAKFYREALIWQPLVHPHILPLFGVYREPLSSSLFMVSPWMEEGTVLCYLQANGRADVNKLLFEIAQGLQYLHSQRIVHGDLCGRNILVTRDGSACLTDFGFSRYSGSSRHSSREGASYHWMAPELVDPAILSVQTFASDVYAFGCVCVELYTGRPPFLTTPIYPVIWKILAGGRPKRPTGNPAMSDRLWQCVNAYWKQDPVARPLADILVSDMREAAESPVVAIPSDVRASQSVSAPPGRPLTSVSLFTMPTVAEVCGSSTRAELPNDFVSHTSLASISSSYGKIVPPTHDSDNAISSVQTKTTEDCNELIHMRQCELPDDTVLRVRTVTAAGGGWSIPRASTPVPVSSSVRAAMHLPESLVPFPSARHTPHLPSSSAAATMCISVEVEPLVKDCEPKHPSDSDPVCSAPWDSLNEDVHDTYHPIVDLTMQGAKAEPFNQLSRY